MNNYKEKKEYKTFTDYNIFPGKIRLIMDNGKVMIVDRDVAIEMAKDQNKNLVQISYNKKDNPKSICKILDYGKYLYELAKKEKDQKKKERLNRADTKEITFSIRIDDGDKNTKIKHIREFIENGDNVKVSVKLLKREMNLLNMAKDMLFEIVNGLFDIAEYETEISVNGTWVSCVLKKRK